MFAYMISSYNSPPVKSTARPGHPYCLMKSVHTLSQLLYRAVPLQCYIYIYIDTSMDITKWGNIDQILAISLT